MPSTMAAPGVLIMDWESAARSQVQDTELTTPVFLQQCLPGQGAQEEVHPHGKDENQDDKALLADMPACQDHGKGVSWHQTDNCAD